MPKKIGPRIAAVAADRKPMTPRICRDKGGESLINGSGLIETFRVHAPPRRSRSNLRDGRVGLRRSAPSGLRRQRIQSGAVARVV